MDEQTSGVLPLVDRYAELLDRKAEMEAELKELNKEIGRAESALADEMVLSEVMSIKKGGYNYTVGSKTEFSKVGGMDEELFHTLREDGLGDIIKETVNANTFRALMRNMAEENDGELPEQYRDLVRSYEHTVVTRRKG